MDAATRLERTSRMKREFHVRFREGFRVKAPLATRLFHAKDSTKCGLNSHAVARFFL